MNMGEIHQDMLKVDFLGFQLINPFILASAPPTRDYDAIRKGFQWGWAGAVTKSVVAGPESDKTPRIGHIYKQNILTATQNFEIGSEYSSLKWIEWTTKLSREFPDRLLYVSLEGGSDIKEWMRLAVMFMDTGIQGLELNFSSPHTDHMGTGSILVQNMDLCADIVRAVRKAVGSRLKIMPKLPYLVHPNEGMAARRLFEAGADAVTAINTIAGLSEFDISTMEPKLNVGGFTAAGGMSYDILRPFARLNQGDISQTKGTFLKKELCKGMGMVFEQDLFSSFLISSILKISFWSSSQIVF